MIQPETEGSTQGHSKVRLEVLRYLKEIHVTLTQFGKKQDNIATLHEDDQNVAQFVETASQSLVTTSKCSRDDVKMNCDDVKVVDSENPKEDSTS
ncbi:hypothetical protein Tco_1184353 [Tanacetum coccineum]